jgi:histidinol-phosphate aminotransferase
MSERKQGNGLANAKCAPVVSLNPGAKTGGATKREVKRAVILAAGRGTRLVSQEEFPKPLKPVAGVALLVRILRTLQAEGITEAVVVIGYRGEQIRKALLAEPSLALKLIFVENDRYDRANGVSLLAAKAFVDQDCILSMADHLYAPELVRRLREADLKGACALAVDYDHERCFDIDDATKVKLAGNKITDIGKEIEDYDAIDTGVFRINRALVDELEKLFVARGDCSLSEGVRALSASGKFVTVDGGEARWIDVDTPEACARAEAMIRVWGDLLGDDPTAAATIDPDALEQFAPTWVRAAQPYKEDHFELAANRQGLARMMSNESPFAPSERVVAAIVEAARAGNNYPSSAKALREKLGAREGIPADGVVLGAGSTEVIDLVIRTFVAPGEEVLISVPTFSMYEARTRVGGGIPVLVPMTDDYGFDIASILRAVTERTKVVFLCTPNNPTGNRLDEVSLRRILRLGLPTVIDEAYHELGDGAPSLAHIVSEFPNAIVIRTFSKAFGLAGMRLGYGLSHPSVAKLMSRAKIPWNISTLTIAAAMAALDDVADQEARVLELRAGRAYLERELSRLAGVGVLKSEGNFVLCDIHETGMSSDAIVQAMLVEGVFIRSLSVHHMDRGFVRVTVGTNEQNTKCVQSLRRVLAAGATRRPSNAGLRAVASDAE